MILWNIAKGFGTPMKVDLTTLNLEKARFARICVEVNLKKPLKGTIQINEDHYFVAYEGLTNICSGCGVYGHLVHNCPRRVTEKAIEKVTPSVPKAPIRTENVNDGFTVVGRQRRNTSPATNKIVFSAKISGENNGRNLRDISQQTNKENIALSNSFGTLEEETISQGLREVEISTSKDKENEIMVIKETKGKSSAQVKEKAFVVGSNRVTNTGPKTQRNQVKFWEGQMGRSPS